MLRLLASMFYRPPILQVAALCWRGTGPKTEILLVKTLDSNRWILPKGWPMRGKTLAEAAEIEAWEEAGVKGSINPESIGHFEVEKRRGNGVKQPSKVEVFALEVASITDDFPEAGQRKVAWFPMIDAAEKLRDPELGELIFRHLGHAPMM